MVSLRSRVAKGGVSATGSEAAGSRINVKPVLEAIQSCPLWSTNKAFTNPEVGLDGNDWVRPFRIRINSPLDNPAQIWP